MNLSDFPENDRALLLLAHSFDFEYALVTDNAIVTEVISVARSPDDLKQGAGIVIYLGDIRWDK